MSFKPRETEIPNNVIIKHQMVKSCHTSDYDAQPMQLVNVDAALNNVII